MKAKRAKILMIAETYWDVLKRTPGSARVKISDARNGDRYLGQENFCVFKCQADARKEIEYLRCNENAQAIDEWEIHVLRADGLWETVAAGVFDLENAPGKRVAQWCTGCGLTLGAVMFREYENGTEWSGNPCCERGQA